jgi:hypothetical protein
MAGAFRAASPSLAQKAVAQTQISDRAKRDVRPLALVMLDICVGAKSKVVPNSPSCWTDREYGSTAAFKRAFILPPLSF